MGALADLPQSFRRLSAAEAATIKPRYLRVVAVKRGDTIASLAARMAYRDAPTERFLALNGLDPQTKLQPGNMVKIVTY